MRFFLTSFFLCCLCFAFGQKQYEKVLLTDGVLHVGNGMKMPSAAVGFENGTITLIKNSLAYTVDKTEWDTVINLEGKHIYPGFVAPNSTLGLTEIDAVRATRDYREVGEFNPHVRAQTAYNVESTVLATVKSNGILITQATPRGGRISGSSSVQFTDGWNWEDATLKVDDGVHVNWPSPLKRSKEDRRVLVANDKYMQGVRELKTFLETAKNYAKMRKPKKKDLRLEAMRNCFKGEKRIYFHANEIKQLEGVIALAQEMDIPFPVIVGGYDSHLISRKLKDSKIPVMLFRPHRLPKHEEDPVDLPYRIASKLQEAGILFCIQNAGGMEAMNARNIPFLAGTSRAYGLSEEEAVAAITLNPCKIMGIDKHFGSVETGKSATLIISDGDALDMRTSKISLAFVQGKIISLDNHQKQLYRKYSEKYRE